MSLLSIAQHGEIAVVTLDNPPVNAISAAVRQALVAAVARCDADAAVRGVVLCCAGRTFLAGADVKEFGLPPVPPHLPDVVAAIEGAAKPWMAAIHGAALGGGLEIAMACRFRVAAPDARLGLPEVTLGVMPGASGTLRLPRLIGVAEAARMILTGTPVAAPWAQKAGLIDALIGGDLAEGAAAVLAERLAAPVPVPVSARPLGPCATEVLEAAEALAKRGGKAARVALETLRYATEVPYEAALIRERENFLALRASPEAAALRHVFFAERAAPRPVALKGVSPKTLGAVGVVGGGTMGAGIAAACLLAGLKVHLLERDTASLGRGRDTIGRTLRSAAARGKLPVEEAEARLAGLGAHTDAAGLAACDLVIEAVFEDIAVKRQVFADLDRACRPDTVLATNTSYLDPRRIAQGLSHPERFLGLHFFSPAHVMKLLEIIPVPQTAPATLATAFALGGRLGKVPVQSGICEGFIGNRILKRTRAEAEALLRAGVSIAEVDAAMRGFGFRMGPFETQDLGGLDIAYLQREGARAEGLEVAETLGDILVRAGRKGQKTFGGWYDYATDSRQPVTSAEVAALLAPHVAAPAPLPPALIVARMLAAMAAEGRAILDEGIAGGPAEIDLVQIHGYGFPREKGGPMYHAEAGLCPEAPVRATAS
ncbi:enoyl-CoA hydratase/isomerase family protein [Pseudooceanicola sp. CBS1P-1]|uniref:3-hydroxyacyl-CoA dehydrogenase n=1 Tax=Pseudooceanicola albus TaxID=2692189 RepID=A0A6L7G2Y1_9RHOB|nr:MULTISPECIES: 3-hydroxyacyl-CoA dehydrogenase NAD-binding domain-containing protein [Pseudooceanicola]MBT9385407.1 enoyl-CoA hydratase/isomerase family protein [Pseudooceanicola endophyticus]MXN18734.1 3-hydroxyacyl-CoA dehydrogenase [Pseudooceanicola albus]